MNLTELVESSGWKNFMKYLYGFGAAVVIVGALFKIMHWPGANVMIIAGLGTEAVIFMFSAFEPLHEELDWTLVYPELAGMTDPEDIDLFKDHKMVDPAIRKKEVHHPVAHGGGSGGGASALNIPNIDDETLSKLGEGLTKLSGSVTNLSDITEASVATKTYMQNMKSAADSVKILGDTYTETNETIKESTTRLSESYFKTAELVTSSGKDVASAYTSLSDALVSESATINEKNKEYDGKLEVLNKNLSALNTAYELQLQEMNQRNKEASKLYEGLDEMTTNLKESVDETMRYKTEISKLSNNLSALNEVYGNMLSAISLKK